MKIINIIGAAIVLLANIYVSFNHSLELFRLGGFSGELAYAGVIGAEVTFLLGVLNVTVSKLRGEISSAPAHAGFYLGVGLILWSNIAAGIHAGVVGIILGAVTPISLIIAEAIIGRVILHKNPEVSKTVKEELNQDEDALLKAAIELYEKSGKIPSRKSFMQEVKATEWQARKALESLRAMV